MVVDKGFVMGTEQEEERRYQKGDRKLSHAKFIQVAKPNEKLDCSLLGIYRQYDRKLLHTNATIDVVSEETKIWCCERNDRN